MKNKGQGKLDLDVADIISRLEPLIKYFELRNKIYQYIFRGKGLEFDGYRDYSQDDDASLIDWKASLRGNQLVAKQYIEERDLKIFLVIDVGDNMVFGSQKKLKCEYAAEIAVAFSHLVLTAGDKIGFIFYSDKVKEVIFPEPGTRQLALLIDKVSDGKYYGGSSDIKVALDYLLNFVDKSVASVVFLSDFLSMTPHASKAMGLAGNKFETISIMVKDPLDVSLPKINEEIVVRDPLTGENILVNPITARKMYEKHALQQEEIAKKIFKEANSDLLYLKTSEDPVIALSNFLKERVLRKRIVV